MARRTMQWFLCLQITVYLLLVFVGGNEDADDPYKNGRNLVLEYFLPINLPQAVDVPLRREKRDMEGSGEEDEKVFSELKNDELKLEGADNLTRKAFASSESDESSRNVEGSGEIENGSESSEEKSDASDVPILAETEVFTTEDTIENRNNSTEIIFDRSEDVDEVSTTRTEGTTTTAAAATTNERTLAVTLTNPTVETTTGEPEQTTIETPESRQVGATTPTLEETTTAKILGETTTASETNASLLSTVEATVPPFSTVETTVPTLPVTETTTPTPTETATAGSPTLLHQVAEEGTKTAAAEGATIPFAVPTTPAVLRPAVVPNATEGLPTPSAPRRTPEPIVEEILKDTKTGNKLEATSGNILQKENLSLGADPLLIANTRLMDSEENGQLSSSEPKRLGAYIVIGLILLSFSSLVGYITFKRRMNRKRQEFESNQESNDTEKALLSLSDYKDNSELEENHLKNNEITPIVVKSNSQINKFEKNTNFSSPKNLNTIANEKNIEKDNVLKSTTENLTQVIIEDSPKDLEEEKNVPGLEKLIVKTRIDQDSIPKKAIIINRSSAGYLPIPQDNS